MKAFFGPIRARALVAASGALLLLSAALALNAWFSFEVLSNLHYGETAAKFRVIVVKLQRDLEADLRFGRGLLAAEDLDTRLLALRRDLLATADATNNRSSEMPQVGLSVLSAGGEVLASTSGRGVVRPLPDTLLQQFLEMRREPGSASDWGYRLSDDTLYVLLPVRTLDNRWGGALTLEVTGGAVSAGGRFFDDLRDIVAAIVLAGIALLTLFVTRALLDFSHGRPVSRRAFTSCCLAVLFGVQASSTAVSVTAFKHEYLNLSRSAAQVTVDLVRKELEPTLDLGVSLRHLADLEGMLGGLFTLNPELGEVTLRDVDGKVIASASSEARETPAATSLGVLGARLLGLTDREGRSEVRVPLRANGTPVATVTATVPDERVYTRIAELVGETFTVLVVSLLLGGELVVLALLLMERRSSLHRLPVEARFSGARPAMFFFLFGIDLSMSFVALHMEELYVPMFGLSREFVIGLPISVEFLFVGLAILGAGYWVDRRGWREPFLVGLTLASIGTLYSGLAPNAMHFIVSRAVLGLGYGFTLLAVQGFVIRNVDEKHITQGLAHVFAGLYAGSLCGNAFGAMLADAQGYTTVFLYGAAVLGALTVYALLFMRGPDATEPAAGATPVVSVEKGALGRFLRDRRVASVVLLASMPAAVVTVGFLNYFSPLYLKELGATQTTIGQVLLVYGLSLVFIGPSLSRMVDAGGNRRMAVFIGSMLGAFALLAFLLLDGLPATLVAMALLGISSSLVLSAQSALLLSLPVAQALGRSTAIGFFRASSRIGQMLGPIVVAGVVVGLNTSMEVGIALIGIGYALASVAFLLTSHDPRSFSPRATAVSNAAPATRTESAARGSTRASQPA